MQNWKLQWGEVFSLYIFDLIRLHRNSFYSALRIYFNITIITIKKCAASFVTYFTADLPDTNTLSLSYGKIWSLLRYLNIFLLLVGRHSHQKRVYHNDMKHKRRRLLARLTNDVWHFFRHTNIWTKHVKCHQH